MDSYAVIETGGKQYRVEKGSTLLVDRLSANEGDKVDLRAVAFREKEMVLGKDLEKVKVEAKVAGHERGPKVRVFKYRPKKGYRRRAGHRSELTRLEITDVKMLSRKPATRTKSSATKTADVSAANKEQGDGS
jgi:large subunit ribosomal protein L21